jgi:hypothetical protein
MWVMAHFTLSGVPATGLSPLVTVVDIDSGVTVVSSGTMVDKNGGFYGYDFAAYDVTKNYTFTCDSVTLSGTERYNFATSGEYGTILDDIHDTVDVVDVRTLLLKKIQTNALKLNDGDTGNWTLYADNGSDPLLTFNVRDKAGDLIIQQVHVPSQRSKAIEY